SRVGDADVDAAVLRHYGSHKSAHGCGVGDIECFGENLSAMLVVDLLCCSMERLHVACTHRDAAAFPSNGVCSSKANSLAGCSYQCDTTLDPQIHGFGEFGIINGRRRSSAPKASPQTTPANPGNTVRTDCADLEGSVKAKTIRENPCLSVAFGFSCER